MQTLFLTFAVEGALLGLLGLVLIALSGPLRRRYGSRWLSRVWLVLALAAAVPLRLVLPDVPAPVQLAPPALLLETVTGEDQTEKDLPQDEEINLPQTPIQITAEPEEPQARPAAPQPGMPEEKNAARPALLDLLAVCWMTGFFVLMLWQWGSYLLWRRWALRSALQPPAAWCTALKEACTAQPGAQPPRLLASRAVRGILVMGFFAPVLLVPEGTQPGPDAPCLLAHELAHLRRRDLFRKALFVAVRALYWYNPAFWLMTSRAAQELESACDEAALAVLGPERRDEYAAALLRAARQGQTPLMTSGFSMTGRQLRARLVRLFDTRPKRRGALLLALLCAAAVSVCGLVACGAAVGTEEEGINSSAGSVVIPELTEEEIWSNVYYTATPWGKESLKTLDSLPFEIDWESPYGIPGYLSPDGTTAGLIELGTDRDPEGGRARLYLWNTVDGGASWTVTEMDFSDWLAGLSERYGWDVLAGENRMLYIRAIHYQMVSPTTGFLVCHGVLRYDPQLMYTEEKGALLILRTTDGGASWQRQYDDDGSDIGFGNPFGSFVNGSQYAFLDADCGFQIYLDQDVIKMEQSAAREEMQQGKLILLQTADGGASWQRVDLSGPEQALPNRPWDLPQLAGPVGLGSHILPQELAGLNCPGSLVLMVMEDGSRAREENRCLLYTLDWGVSWQLAEWKEGPADEGGE